jgi:hypothetical protein
MKPRRCSLLGAAFFCVGDGKPIAWRDAIGVAKNRRCDRSSGVNDVMHAG